IGKEVAEALNLPLDIIVTRKIGAPGNEEYAIGAIDIHGNGVWNENERAYVDKRWLENKIKEETREAERRWSTYRKDRGPLELKGKTVIIVDDGIATGLTMQAAVAYARQTDAEKVVVAVPVASIESIGVLKEATEVYVIETPAFFSAVGEWYEYFPQVSDQEVVSMLAS
ncbi:MAG: phosphoribosyltransferase family protein, partial [Minisyncoccia bacterium]